MNDIISEESIKVIREALNDKVKQMRAYIDNYTKDIEGMNAMFHSGEISEELRDKMVDESITLKQHAIDEAYKYMTAFVEFAELTR